MHRLAHGLRPKLSADQVRDVGLAHVVNLDAIARGDAPPAILWDLVRSVLTWSRAAHLAGIGEVEMQRQFDMVVRMLDRFQRTGRVLFDGPDYQLAKVGLQVMDELARSVDQGVAIAAAEWSDLQVSQMAAEVAAIQQAGAAA